MSSCICKVLWTPYGPSLKLWNHGPKKTQAVLMCCPGIWEIQTQIPSGGWYPTFLPEVATVHHLACSRETCLLDHSRNSCWYRSLLQSFFCGVGICWFSGCSFEIELVPGMCSHAVRFPGHYKAVRRDSVKRPPNLLP